MGGQQRGGGHCGEALRLGVKILAWRIACRASPAGQGG